MIRFGKTRSSLRGQRRARSRGGLPSLPVVTNLLNHSEDFSQWSATNVVVNIINGPNGTLTADRVQAQAQTFGGLVRAFFNYTVGANYTLSCYIKKANHRTIGFRVDASKTGSDERYPFYDFDTGVLNTNGIAGVSMGAYDAGNGWIRVWVTVNNVQNVNGLLDIAIVNSSGAAQPALGGTEQVYLWGAQLCTGASPGQYQFKA